MRPALRERNIINTEPVDLSSNTESLEEIFSLLPPRWRAAETRVDFEYVGQGTNMEDSQIVQQVRESLRV